MYGDNWHALSYRRLAIDDAPGRPARIKGRNAPHAAVRNRNAPLHQYVWSERPAVGRFRHSFVYIVVRAFNADINSAIFVFHMLSRQFFVCPPSNEVICREYIRFTLTRIVRVSDKNTQFRACVRACDSRP